MELAQGSAALERRKPARQSIVEQVQLPKRPHLVESLEAARQMIVGQAELLVIYTVARERGGRGDVRVALLPDVLEVWVAPWPARSPGGAARSPGGGVITSGQLYIPSLDPKFAVESIYEVPGASNAHLEILEVANWPINKSHLPE